MKFNNAFLTKNNKVGMQFESYDKKTLVTVYPSNGSLVVDGTENIGIINACLRNYNSQIHKYVKKWAKHV